MAIRLTVLGSGSAGNSTCIEGKGTRLLLDAGFSCRQLSARLEAVGVRPAAVDGIVVIHEHVDHVRGAELFSRKYDVPVYCTAAMAHEGVEQLRLLFLDRKNALISDEVQQQGTIDHTPLYTREVVKRALELGASALIVVHNHPSGDPTPSQGDIKMTRDVRDALEKIGVTLHDHLVIGRNGHESFRARGLL